MLDLAKVAALIQESKSTIWAEHTDAYAVLVQAWHTIIDDPLFTYRVACVSGSPWAIPSWHDPLSVTVPLKPYAEPYTIISTDGSQIYPDRHAGVSCGLINIGTVTIPYHNAGQGVLLTHDPILVLPQAYGDEVTAHDYVTIKRQEYEFQYAIDAALRILARVGAVLFDGSLIFWHLQPISGYESWVQTYTALLAQFERTGIPYGAYISAPKSKEVLNLIRLHLCDFNPARQELYAAIQPFSDGTIMAHHLPVGHRSLFFKSNAPVTLLYPASQRPYFCYIHHSAEIGRLELPAWVVHNEQLCTQFVQIVWDQLEKGKGYPISLAEAHEQAVVKGPDRQLFYNLLERLQEDRGLFALSRKQFFKNRPFI